MAARKVKAARENSGSRSSSSSGDIRKFAIPKLNFEASDYYELVNWVDIPRHEPPITCNLTDYDIEEAIKSGSMPHLEKYPCHTQAVERHIKVVTDAAKWVYGKEHREGYIRAKLKSRKRCPNILQKMNGNHNVFITKLMQDFKCTITVNGLLCVEHKAILHCLNG